MDKERSTPKDFVTQEIFSANPWSLSFSCVTCCISCNYTQVIFNVEKMQRFCEMTLFNPATSILHFVCVRSSKGNVFVFFCVFLCHIPGRLSTFARIQWSTNGSVKKHQLNHFNYHACTDLSADGLIGGPTFFDVFSGKTHPVDSFCIFYTDWVLNCICKFQNLNVPFSSRNIIIIITIRFK